MTKFSDRDRGQIVVISAGELRRYCLRKNLKGFLWGRTYSVLMLEIVI